MPHGGEDGADDLRFQQRSEIDPLRGDRRVECIPGGFERRKTGADGRPKEGALLRVLRDHSPPEDDEKDTLHELFDQADEAVDPEALGQIGLEQGCSENTEDAADEEREDELQRADSAGHSFDDEQHDRKRDQEAANQDQSRDEVRVARQCGHHHRDSPQGQADEQGFPPPAVMVVLVSIPTLASRVGGRRRRRRVGVGCGAHRFLLGFVSDANESPNSRASALESVDLCSSLEWQEYENASFD